jgi:DNA-binding response OmpR family regulator
MIKYSQTLFLISSDKYLNDALTDQFKLVNSLAFKILEDLEDLKEVQHADLIILNEMNKGQFLLKNLSKIKINNNSVIIVLLDHSERDFYKEDEKLDNLLIIEKPFDYGYLEKIIMQQLHKRDLKVINLEKNKFYPSKRLLVKSAGAEIRLTEKESDILIFLFNYNNQVVSKKQLLQHVWGYKDGVTTHTLETHLYYLRKKLGSDTLILTEKNGYVLSI